LSTFIDMKRVWPAGVLAVFLAGLAAYIDWSTWIELNVPVVYGVPLVVSLPTRNRRLLWGMATCLLMTTFIVYEFQSPPGPFSPLEPFFVDRVLAAAAVLLTACLVHIRMSSIDTMDAQRAALREQNEELERRRREAEEASARKTTLLGFASHDIRTPVNNIKLMAEVIRLAATNQSLTARIPDLADRLHANALSLDHLISDLLDVAHFDSGRVDVQESVFLLNDLLVEVCRDHRALAEAKNLRLVVEAPDQEITVRTDRIKLARVISNIVGNAIKFTQIGSVVVSASVISDQVSISVRDSGVGIAPAHLDRIFDEFTQLQDGERGQDDGWGLGLAICRRLMLALGGNIAVESEPRQGSLFIISLPTGRVGDSADVGSAPVSEPIPGA
jgi:signal transduction histidine kinase